MRAGRSVPVDTKTLLLHEAGYRCSNPACRSIITLEIHHIEFVSAGGSNDPSNLLVLCPNCHSLHHTGIISIQSLRAWKFLLLALNEAFDRRGVDVLLALGTLRELKVSGDGVLSCSPGIAAGLIKVETRLHADDYWVSLTERGKALVLAWKQGNQELAVQSGALSKGNRDN
jgi:HNH endonuclease